ncbi:MFS transporter [Actinomadura sp. HBU206391]|uniref:MFS transporter n=1 Tax=Actinomadura sp. HBU206391 TaxID=2731692 RepID=UPI00164FA64D|nr:MFS transporter [Actinomadura sp. HBU206391]MBC6463159.1 MFS transporter [Actinomadura sp. HBU206391]
MSVSDTVASVPSSAVIRRWPTAMVLGSAMFLVLFDSLAVATALPRIGAELDLRPTTLQWVVSLYSLSIGGLLLLGGRVCDVWGRRRLLVASLTLCAGGSLLAGSAPGLPLLLTGRVLQGVAAAFAIPATLAMAATLFPEEPWRSRVFSVVAVSGNSAGLAGAVCGGLLAAEFGWRWVFLAPVPVSVLAVAAAMTFLPPDPPGRPERERFDIAGAVLATVGPVALIYGCGRLAEPGPAAAVTLGPIVGGLGLLAGLVVVERRAPHPLVRPGLLRSRRLVGCCLAFAAHSAAYAAVVVVGSLYLQDVHGLSAAGAGLILAPVLLASLVSALPAGALIRRYGSRVVVAGALVLCAFTLTLVAVNAGGDLAAVLPWFIAWGLSAGPVYVGLTRECIGDAATGDRGTASALFESTTHIGGALSVAAYLTLFGAGFGYRSALLAGAGAVAVGVLTTLVILPRPARHKARA